MPYRKSAPYDGLNEILEWREEEIGRKQEHIGNARRQTKSLTDRTLGTGQGTGKSFSLFQYFTFTMKFCIIHTGGKIGKKRKLKINERRTNFRREGNSLISHMKYFTYSSSSKAPSIAPGHGCCSGYSCKEQQTPRREQWEDNGHPLKTVVRRDISVGQL